MTLWTSTCSVYAYEKAIDKFPIANDDKIRHCYASCLLNKCTLFTGIPSFLSGFSFEVLQGLTDWGVYDQADVEANLAGIIASYLGDCEKKCKCPL